MLLEKKICMIGSFAVGKTSLVRQFIEGIYSEKYITTMGVKVDKKPVTVGGSEVKLVLWDIYGDDDLQKMNWTYVRGAHGYLLVADLTRPATLAKALELEERMRKEAGKEIPFVFAANKCDVVSEWNAEEELKERIANKGWKVLRTSAKSGERVQEAFEMLALAMLSGG